MLPMGMVETICWNILEKTRAKIGKKNVSNWGGGGERRGEAGRGGERRGEAGRGGERRGEAGRGGERRGEAGRGGERRGEAGRGGERRGEAGRGGGENLGRFGMVQPPLRFQNAFILSIAESSVKPRKMKKN